MSKPSYATYVKDRLTGFGGASHPLAVPGPRRLSRAWRRRVFGDPGRARRKTPACTGADRRARPRGGRAPTSPTSRRRSAGVKADEGFMTRRLAGRRSRCSSTTTTTRRHEDYLFAIADAMRHEYEAIAEAGFVLQIDCPDLAHGPAHPVRRRSSSRSSARWRGCTSRRSTTRCANIPPEQVRMHLCWGNYEGPHHHDVPLADIIDIVFVARPARHLVRGGQPAPRARVGGVRDA